MFPWQHILETALIQNWAIRISSAVIVMLFFNQSSQNLEIFLEMISSTSVQSFSNTFFEDHLGKIGSKKSVMTLVMTSLSRQLSVNLSKILYFCLYYQDASLYEI